jgi:hypothetical protein
MFKDMKDNGFGKKVLIVGGVAEGRPAAARLRRLMKMLNI